MSKMNDLTNQRFGKLVAIEPEDERIRRLLGFVNAIAEIQVL